MQKIEALTGKKINHVYMDKARAGDHICYISDLRKLKAHYPNWKLSHSLDQILEKMVRPAKSPPAGK